MPAVADQVVAARAQHVRLRTAGRTQTTAHALEVNGEDIPREEA